MFFLPFTLLIFILFILFLPILFVLGYFHIIIIGFERLGISPAGTLFILFLILIGSFVNIPLTKKKLVYVERPYFFGLWRIPKLEARYLAINLGGAIIPTLLSFYFLFFVWKEGFDFGPIFITTFLMILISNFFAKVIPRRGITLPAFIPPLFSAIFSLIFAPEIAASCAFISGVLGTLIGADIFNLRKIQKISPGFISIGGAGIFDGIFLVGIVSALMSGL